MIRMRLLVIGVGLGAATAGGQVPGPSAADTGQAAFVATVREVTARYRDIQVAKDDGFRKIGPDFPGMGEHWINVPRLLEPEIDISRPPILEYATIDGKPTLLGAAYAVLLQNGAEPPTAGLPITRDRWHYHGGTVSEESFVLGHAHHLPSDPTKSRLAVLHVWAWLDNPTGPFATDNWALPFARLGIPTPTLAPEPAASNAVALAAGGEPYFATLVAVSAGAAAQSNDEVTVLLKEAAKEILGLLGTRPDGLAMAAAGERWLELRDAIHNVSGVALP
jgi:hypothetical protein